MFGSKIPRYLLIVLAFGAAFGITMVSMFYGQYRWLANELLTTSETEHEAFLEASYERRVRSQMHEIADQLAAELVVEDDSSHSAALDRALVDNDVLLGIRLHLHNGQPVESGWLPETSVGNPVTWLPDAIVVRYPVARDNEVLGALTGAFRLDEMRQEATEFHAELMRTESESSRISYAWIGLGTATTVAIFASCIWMIIRRQTRRIRALREQAEKLRDADFGEPLPQSPGDSLGELAAVFNDMRDRLQQTTVSRDYFYSILSGMNEAIIVTTEEGRIKQINKAATILLGYDEEDLVGASIDFILNKKKSPTLITDEVIGIPREAFFESKFGETIPVSYTCSVVPGQDNETRDRVFAAQNITERRRAEQRIRYLARIDALTKIPNRMQFQHLLQRAIARARRAGEPLCLFYIDVDHFKEINDTFGHLAGDATLETVAERLSAALPEKSIIGRLAGDEFAVIVPNLGPDSSGRADTDKLARALLDRLPVDGDTKGSARFVLPTIAAADSAFFVIKDVEVFL